MKTSLQFESEKEDIASFEFSVSDAIDVNRTGQIGICSDRLFSLDDLYLKHPDNGNYKEAESLLLRELTLVLQQSDTVDNPGAAECLRDISDLYYKMGDIEAGDSFNKIALAVGRRVSAKAANQLFS